MNWLKQIFSRRRIYDDLSAEMHEHLEEKIEELIANGLSRKEASAAARRAFGNLTLIENDCRDVWQWPSVEQFFSDARFGLRGLRRDSGFAVVAILTFALGISSITAIYSVTYATLLAPLPYPEPKQLVMVWPTRANKRVWGASTGDFLDWKRESTVFQDLNAATASGTSFNLATSARPEHVIAQQATRLRNDRSPFLLGRSFLPEEGTPGKDRVVILTYKLWKRLGADSGIIGKPLRMDGAPYTVVGVTAPGPLDRIQFEMVVPLVFRPDQINHGYHWLFVMTGHLKQSVTIAEAQADMSVVALRIAQDNPQTNTNWWVSVEPLQDDFLSPAVKTTLWLL